MRKRRAGGAGDFDLFGDAVARPVPQVDAAPRSPDPGYPRVHAHSPSHVSDGRGAAPDGGLSDAIPGSSPEAAVSVATLTHTTKDVIEGAFLPLWVRGEVSDFKAHRNGHWYFCLRDAGAQIKCVMWSRDQRRVPAAPDDGMQVAVLGQLTVYPARGDLQFAAKAILAEGDGLWRKALEETTRRLEAEGLLAPERKRPLPRFRSGASRPSASRRRVVSSSALRHHPSPSAMIAFAANCRSPRAG